MPIRSVVLFNVGPPFGGFRLAVHPGVFGLNDTSAFDALEDALVACHAALRSRPPSTWHDLPEAMFEPDIRGRRASIDVTGDVTDTAGGDLVARARLPFQTWPFGGWVVHEGWHRAADGSWSPFTDGELARVW
jgi:hypothetical protein